MNHTDIVVIFIRVVQISVGKFFLSIV